MIRVALVDDQPLFRMGIGMVIDSQKDMTVAWQAGHGQEAVDALASQPVDVILMDVQMPVLDGIAATRAITANHGTDSRPGAAPHPRGTDRHPGGTEPRPGEAEPDRNTPRVVILTTFDTDEYVLEGLAAGASGFLLKDTSPEDLLAALRTVVAGEAVISPRATRRLLTHLTAGVAGPAPVLVDRDDRRALDSLTEREQEILVAIGRGWSNTEIAQRLFISMPTVKTHVGRVLAKLGARDRVHAVLFAFRTGLVDRHDLLGQ